MKRISNPFREDMIRIQKELKKLQSCTVHIGIMGDAGSDLLMIAGVHEYGATIHPKKAKIWLSRLPMKQRKPEVHEILQG